MLCAVLGTQLVLRLVSEVSEDAVRTYGVSTYGHEETYRSQLEIDPTTATTDIATMRRALSLFRERVPGSPIVLVGSVQVDLTSRSRPALSPRSDATLWAIDGPWDRVSGAFGAAGQSGEDVGRSTHVVTIAPDVAQDLLDPGEHLITVHIPVTPPEAGSPGNGKGPRRVTAAQVTQHAVGERGPAEPNPALPYSAITSIGLLDMIGATPESADVYWVCSTSRECEDTNGAVKAAAAAAGLPTPTHQRIDGNVQLRPLLAQQAEDRQRISWLVAGLGLLAVVVVTTALVESRRPEVLALRSMGARPSQIVGMSALETLMTSVMAAAVAIATTTFVAQLAPDSFNTIGSITVDAVSIPRREYVRVLGSALLAGAVASALPSLRIARTVRATRSRPGHDQASPAAGDRA